MDTRVILRNAYIISGAFLLTTAAYAGKPSADSKTTLGSLSPFCILGQIAQYNGTTWECAPVSSGGGAAPQFEVKDNNSTTVGTLVGFSGPNIAQVLIAQDSNNYLLEVTSEGFMAHPRVNVNPVYAGDSRRPVIYYYENSNCNASTVGAVYTHSGNFLPPFGGGFSSALSDSNGYVVILENGAANLYTAHTTSPANYPFSSVRYMGRCINYYNGSFTAIQEESNLAALDLNDFNDLPGDVALTCVLFSPDFSNCTATGVVILGTPPVDLYSSLALTLPTPSTPFTLNTVPTP